MDRNRIEENFLTAMQTIAKAEVAAVKYDQTITCTIVDDSLRESGQYMVSDGTTRFPAYSSITSLRNNTVVYVTVPNGDFTQQKVIIGKQMEGEDKSFLYIAPFDNFIPCTPNLLTEAESTNNGEGYKLFANGDMIELDEYGNLKIETDTQGNPFWNPKDKNFDENGKIFLNPTKQIIAQKDNLVNYYKGFTRLGIRADFISWLKDYQIASGNYGLRLVLSYQDGTLVDTTNLEGLEVHIIDKEKYLRTENGFNSNREYYIAGSEKMELIALTKETYSHQKKYYYKNYILDQNKTARIKNITTDENGNEQTIYFTYYQRILDGENGEKYKCVNKDENGNFIETFNYIPNTYYYVPEEVSPNENDQYKLSEENGYIENCNYFSVVIEDGKKVLSLNPNVKDNYEPGIYYGVLPVYQIKETTATILDIDHGGMIGNPYAFDSYYQQEIVFNIENVNTITGLRLEFFEDGNFTSTENIYTYQAQKPLLVNNLFDAYKYYGGYETLTVNNIEMYMGYTAEALGEEEGYLQLFCYDLDKYRAVSNSLLNMKNIYLKWAYKHSDGEIYIADKDNVGSFVEKINQTVADFPEDGSNEEKLAYFDRMKIDGSAAKVEERKYYERFITDTKPDNISGMLGDIYITAFYNFIPNQGEEYSQKRDYFMPGVFPISEIEKSTIINKEYLKRVISEIKEPIITEEGKQYLEVLSTGEYLSRNLPAGSKIDPTQKRWATYDYVSTSKETAQYVRGYKKMPVNENVSRETLYNYYYANYTITDDNTSDKGDLIYIYYLTANPDIMGYTPDTYYYYDALNELFKIKWYRYVQGAPAADEHCGVYWQEIPNLSRLIETVLKDENLSAEEQSEAIQKLYDTYVKTTHLIDDFHCELHPDYVYNAKEQIKAIVFMGDKVFYSEPIEFINESPTIDLPTLEVETALAPKFDDGSLGNYYLYGENNSLIDIGESQTQRSISLLFDATNGVSGSRSLLKNADKVTWIFPLENTAIVPSLSLTSGIYTERDGMGYIEDTEQREEYKFYYTIAKYYSYSDGDNSIVCNVIKDGVLYSTTANMSFGQSGSNGSEYTLTLDLMTSDNMITINPTNQLWYKGLTLWKEEYKKINNIDPSSSNANVYPYKTIGENYYILEMAWEKDEKNEDIQKKVFKQINIDDYDWTNSQFDNLYIARMYVDNADNRTSYPCLDEYMYEYDTKKSSYIKAIKYDPLQIYYEQDNETYEKTETKITQENYSNYYIKQKSFSKVNISTNPVNEPMKVVASLYDQTHKRLDLNNYTVTWDWEYPSSNNVFASIKDASGPELILTWKQKPETLDRLMFILKAKVSGVVRSSGSSEYDLEAYLPIPFRYDFGPVRYQGPTEILHNSFGTPLFYKDEMNLYYNDIEGNFQKYPYNWFHIYPEKDNEEVNGLYPQLKMIALKVFQDKFKNYTLQSDKIEKVEQYYIKPLIKEINNEIPAVQQTQKKAWAGYWKKDPGGEYKLIPESENNKIIPKDSVSIYDLSNLYQVEQSENYSQLKNGSSILYQNGLYYLWDDENNYFSVVPIYNKPNNDIIEQSFFETDSDSFYAQLASNENKYKLVKDTSKWIDITYTGDSKPQLDLYEKQEEQIYKRNEEGTYDANITYYIPTDYKQKLNVSTEDTNLYIRQEEYVYQKNLDSFEKNESYYKAVSYREDTDGNFYIEYRQLTKDKDSQAVFKPNQYYYQHNDEYLLITTKLLFDQLWIQGVNKDPININIYEQYFTYVEKENKNENENPDRQYYSVFEYANIIENEKIEPSKNYFIKNISHNLVDSVNLESNQIYYVPSEYEEISKKDINDKYQNEYNLLYTLETKEIYVKTTKFETNTTYYYRKQYFVNVEDNYKGICYIFKPTLIQKVSTDSASVQIEKGKQYVFLDFTNAEVISQFDDNHFCFTKDVKTINNATKTSNKEDSGCFFVTPSIYIDNMEQFAVQVKRDSTIIFSVPILYYLNRYFSSTINSWDGKLKIDNENDTILAKMMGAGRKEDNLFSGVIMGDWSQNTNSDLGIGIYGFNKGETSFGFTDDGQGFIGKAGHGRIIFDGDNAQLRSANYAGGWNGINGKNSGEFSYQSSGLLIDLDDAFLLATANDKTRYIKIDAKTTGSYKVGNTIVYPEPLAHPAPNRTSIGEDYKDTQQYPFVVYGGPNLYTEIGWNGDLKLKGNCGSLANVDSNNQEVDTGEISLDASGIIPFKITSAAKTYDSNNKIIGLTNRYIQMNWDASIVLSGANGLSGQRILLDASAPYDEKNSPLPYQYWEDENNKKAWISQDIDRPFQVGNYLRATWDGYLEAQGAFFKNSNANAFNVHYVLNDDSVSKEDNFFIGRGVAGTMGYIEGSNQNGYTNNVGLSSSQGHGIKLISETNLSISATNHSNTTKDENKTEEQIASISQQNEEDQTMNTNQYVETKAYISGVVYYFYKDNEEYLQAYYTVQVEGNNEASTQINIYEITDENDFSKALENHETTRLFYESITENNKNSTESEATADENKSSSTVGGIYIEAGRIFSSKITNEKDGMVTLQVLSDDGKMSNLVTNGFSILDLGQYNSIDGKYNLLMNLSLETTEPRRWKLEYNNLNNTIFNTGTFYIQDSAQKLLFNILEAKNTVAKSQTTIQTDVTILSILNNKLETAGGIKINGIYNETEAYGLYNANKTCLIGNVGIGSAPTSDKLYVYGNSYFKGSGTFSLNLNVDNKTTTKDLTATGTIKLRTDGSDTNPTITVNSSGITFTGGADKQSGIYARFA